MPSPVKQFQVTFACADTERVARFWAEALGYDFVPPSDGVACVDPTGVGPRLFFQRVPEGKVVKNRLHLDVRIGTGLVADERVAALEAECARLVALGAVRVQLQLQAPVCGAAAGQHAGAALAPTPRTATAEAPAASRAADASRSTRAVPVRGSAGSAAARTG